MKHILALSLALLMIGCVASPESYLTAHPGTPPNIAASIRQGDVVVGMTREQVRLVWGMPNSKAEWSGGDSWAYTRSGYQGVEKLPSEWGMPVNSARNKQPSQASFAPPMQPAGKPRKMVYFHGDQVVVVEKAEGEF